jgi:hypothetical protein
MDFNILKIAAFIILLLIYLSVRKFFKNVANYTEKLGQSFDDNEITEETKTISKEQL